MNGKLVHDKRYDGRVHMVSLMPVRTSQWEMIWWINSWAYFQKITRANEIVKSVIPWNSQISNLYLSRFGKECFGWDYWKKYALAQEIQLGSPDHCSSWK